jgi:hypothetical protein
MVSDLLARSLAAHKRAQQLRHKGDSAAATVALTEARDLRMQAIAEDPEHTDPAWTDEQGAASPGTDTHAAMMQFYATKLGS